MSKYVHLITVGKLKNKELEKIEMDYLKRINNLKIHEVKAKAENKDLEGKVVISKIQELCKGQDPYPIVLTEWGKEYTSIEFSKFVFSKIENSLNVVFVICGAEGPSEELLEYSKSQFSLSKLTFPHKIARLLFIEQFYRAITIHNNHPYHN
jgi:23S rRNA (pseudouridine1915-N3)-methyltransferase